MIPTEWSRSFNFLNKLIWTFNLALNITLIGAFNLRFLTSHYFSLSDYNPCIGVTCPYYAVCQPISETKYNCTCQPCKFNESEPLCDNNDVTHQSICKYKYKVCMDKEEPGIKHYGGCKRKYWILSNTNLQNACTNNTTKLRIKRVIQVRLQNQQLLTEMRSKNWDIKV